MSKHARNTDPGTSHAAAGAATGVKAESMRSRLLAVFEACPAGLTADEARIRAGYPVEAATWKRVSDLKNEGVIEDTGYTRSGVAGRLQSVLCLARDEWTLL